MNREKLLQQIRAADFYITDLNLYLDTHPEDKYAIGLYNEAVKRSKELTKQFEEMYGPLTIKYENKSDCYEWVKDPWPWEGGSNVGL